MHETQKCLTVSKGDQKKDLQNFSQVVTCVWDALLAVPSLTETGV